MAETQHSVRIVKSFVYRNVVTEWSNRYFFNGAVPDNWANLIDAVKLLEVPVHTGLITFVRGHGYAPGSQVAVATRTFSGTGSLAPTDTARVPGDCAHVLRMATTKRTIKNHPVYVFSYMHGSLYVASGGLPDVLHPTQKAALETYGTAWLDGFTVNGRVYKRTTPDGALTTGRAVDGFISHRDFPR